MATLANARSARGWRGWDGGVWLLAAALGAITVAFGASLLHEGGQRRSAAHVFARGVAAQLGTRARGTLESIALSKLAAAVVLPRASAPARSTLDALAAGEREEIGRAACRE